MYIVKPARRDSMAAVNAWRQNQSLRLFRLNALEGGAVLQDGLKTI